MAKCADTFDWLVCVLFGRATWVPRSELRLAKSPKMTRHPFSERAVHLVGRSGPNLEPGTMRVYLTNGPQNGLNIDRKVGPFPGSRRRWVLSSVHAVSQALHAENTYRPRFQVRTRPS